MWACLRFHLLHIWRSHFLLLWIVFALFVQYSAVQLLHLVTLHYQASPMALGLREVVIAMIYVQFCTGCPLAIAYGIWVVPYLHEESRAPLTFALPVNKAIFPAVYAASFLLMYALQNVIMFANLTAQFGASVWTVASFPWGVLASGTLLSVMALEAVVFAFSAASLVFGKLAAFIGGTTVLLILQVSGVTSRMSGIGEGSLWRLVHSVLPPLGEVWVDLMELKDGFDWQGPGGQHLVLWAIWLALLAVLFRVRLDRA